MSIPSTRTAALWYASQRWEIFPVWPVENGRCKCGVDNCENIGKHPVTYINGKRVAPNGHQNATNNQRIINTWWDIFPGWNIGTSSHFRIDVDTKNGGLDNWRDLLGSNTGHDTTPICKTPSGGMHIYFKSGEDYGHSNQEGDLPTGIDVRGEGSGYTLLPPSNHIDGIYKWAESAHPKSVEIADAPQWLIDLIGPDNIVVSNPEFNDADMPDVESLSVSGLVKALVAGDRSRIDECVITSLVRGGLTDDQIRAVFINSPPTEKYSGKNGNRDKYLALSIAKARAWLKKVNQYNPVEDTV